MAAFAEAQKSRAHLIAPAQKQRISAAGSDQANATDASGRVVPDCGSGVDLGETREFSRPAAAPY
jgi:hypothetical protein